MVIAVQCVRAVSYRNHLAMVHSILYGGICDQIDFIISSITNEMELNQHEQDQRKLQKRNHKIKRELNKLIELHANMHK